MKQVTLQQNTPEWLAFRKERIGASDAPSILGVGFKTPFELWQEKMGLKENNTNSAMRRGTELEEPARQRFTQLTGIKMTPFVCLHDDYDYLMASLDGIDASGSKILEIKCPGSKDHQTALQGKIPDKYKYQLQHQMMCTGVAIMFYFSFDGQNGKIIEVERDQSMIDHMLEEENKFYQKMVNKEAPELTPKDFVKMTDPSWKEAALQYINLDKQIKSLDDQKKIYRDMLIAQTNGNPAMCEFLRLSKSFRKGGIDEEKAIQDGVDLNKYRKPMTMTWTIRKTT